MWFLLSCCVPLTLTVCYLFLVLTPPLVLSLVGFSIVSIGFHFISWLVSLSKPYLVCASVCLCKDLSSQSSLSLLSFYPWFCLLFSQFHLFFSSSMNYFPHAFVLYISACTCSDTCDGRCQTLWSHVPVCGGKHFQNRQQMFGRLSNNI